MHYAQCKRARFKIYAYSMNHLYNFLENIQPGQKTNQWFLGTGDRMESLLQRNTGNFFRVMSLLSILIIVVITWLGYMTVWYTKSISFSICKVYGKHFLIWGKINDYLIHVVRQSPCQNTRSMRVDDGKGKVFHKFLVNKLLEILG